MDIEKFIDVFSAQERFMSNEKLYKSFLFEFPNRTLYQELKAALEQKNIEQSFDIAHRMKGIIENLSLNILTRKIREVVEILRVGQLPEDALLQELDEAYRESMQTIIQIKEGNIQIFC